MIMQTDVPIYFLIFICGAFIVLGCNQISDKKLNFTAWEGDTQLEISGNTYYYQKDLFSGIVRDSFANGQIKYQKSVLKGIVHGDIRGWHSNGNLSYKYQCHNGKRDGVYLEYFPNGSLQIQQLYEKGDQIENKVMDTKGAVLVNFKKRNNRIYGLLGSSVCRSVYNEEEFVIKDAEL